MPTPARATLARRSRPAPALARAGRRCAARALENAAQRWRRSASSCDWQVQELERWRCPGRSGTTLQADHGRLAHAASLIEAAEYALEALSEGEAACARDRQRRRRAPEALRVHDPGAEGDARRAGAGADPDAGGGATRCATIATARPRSATACARSSSGSTRSRRWRASTAWRPSELPESSASCGAAGRAGASGSIPEALRSASEAAAREAYASAARKLSKLRTRARRPSCPQQVTAAMQALAMAGGRFEVALAAARGAVRARARAGRVPGRRPRRAARRGRWPRWPPAASCRASAWRSRRSRAAVAEVPTLVFDEVDAGIGGARRRDRRPHARGARRRAPGDVHHPPAAGGRRRGPAVAGDQERGEGEVRCRACAARRAASASRRSRACWAG